MRASLLRANRAGLDAVAILVALGLMTLGVATSLKIAGPDNENLMHLRRGNVFQSSKATFLRSLSSSSFSGGPSGLARRWGRRSRAWHYHFRQPARMGSGESNDVEEREEAGGGNEGRMTLEDLVSRLEKGELDQMLSEGIVSTLESKAQNATNVMELSHAECVKDYMSERIASGSPLTLDGLFVPTLIKAIRRGRDGVHIWPDPRGSKRARSPHSRLSHKWEQYEDRFALYISLPEGTNTKDLNVEITKGEVTVTDSSSDRTIAMGTLRYPVVPSDCNWCVELDDGRKNLVISLVKDKWKKMDQYNENQVPKMWIKLFEEE
eukprot:jgi/Bigna1/79829/fgenesh1_pg.65_\